jgi:alkylhydroperoxidase/carboxymuconolactone decarboxylase family protein YurZ
VPAPHGFHYVRHSQTHIRAARNNGCTKAEIRNAFLQCAVYAGVPVMRDAVRVAQEVFAEEGKSIKPSRQARQA